KDPAFDELDDDTMETEDAQDVERTSYVVHEEKESAEKGVSTEDPLSTAQSKVSDDKPEDSTDRPDKGTVSRIDSRSPSFTPFGGSDFLMEEIDEFLERDDSIPLGVDGIYDSEGDTVYLEELLSVINSDPNLPSSPVCEISVP
ncbi:hypothetical protein Tco_0202251, partial [Tanacetum coccineum]